MAHFLCHLGCSHFGALLLDFYFTENMNRPSIILHCIWHFILQAGECIAAPLFCFKKTIRYIPLL